MIKPFPVDGIQPPENYQTSLFAVENAEGKFFCGSDTTGEQIWTNFALGYHFPTRETAQGTADLLPGSTVVSKISGIWNLIAVKILSYIPLTKEEIIWADQENAAKIWERKYVKARIASKSALPITMSLPHSFSGREEIKCQRLLEMGTIDEYFFHDHNYWIVPSQEFHALAKVAGVQIKDNWVMPEWA